MVAKFSIAKNNDKLGLIARQYYEQCFQKNLDDYTIVYSHFLKIQFTAI